VGYLLVVGSGRDGRWRSGWLAGAVVALCLGAGCSDGSGSRFDRRVAAGADAGADAAASAGAGADRSSRSDANNLIGPLNLSIGTDQVVAVFPAPDGIFVVRRGHVELVSRDGVRVGLIAAPREITAAAFDGARLAVADRAVMTFYGPRLAVTGSAPLVDRCEAVAATSAGFVCEPEETGQRGFSTYDADAGGARAASPPDLPSDEGVGPLARVPIPGQERVLLLDLTTTLYTASLFDVSPSGILSLYVARDIGGPNGISAMAFDGDPAQRLVLDRSDVYLIAPPGCSADKPDQCLLPDGQLPTVEPPNYNFALAGGGQGAVQVLRAFSSGGCAGGCALQSIDLATRAITASRMFGFAAEQPIDAQYDPVTGGMVLASRTEAGDRVDLLALSSASSPAAVAEPDPRSGPAPVPAPADAPASGCVAAATLMRAPSPILSVFPVAQGEIVVRTDAVVLIDRRGGTLATVTAARDLLAAAFDAGTLAVADDVGISLYDQQLHLLRTVAIDGGCTSLVIVGGRRLVCETPTDVAFESFIATTWSLDSGAQLASAVLGFAVTPHLENGLWRVPGTDAVVATTTFLSPQSYQLYEVAADGTFAFVDSLRSNRYGEFLSDHIGFYGSGIDADPAGLPAAHLIDPEGRMLWVVGPRCRSAAGDGLCFPNDGDVGTSWGEQQFAALANDAQGQLYALVGPELPSDTVPVPGQPADYRLQHIDVGAHQLVSSRHYSLNLEDIATMAFDEACGMVVLAYTTYADGPAASYRVDLLDYGRR